MQPGQCALLYLVSFACCYAQTGQPLTWLRDLTPEQGRDKTAMLRGEIGEWLAAHPDYRVDLAPAPAQPWSDDQVRAQIALLKQAVEDAIRNDPSHPFYLGLTSINVTASVSALSPISDTLDQTEIVNRDALTVKDAIEYLPGVSVDHKAPRNQSGISIGGFDIRQVPLYMDGIPIYVPFDGFVDLSRYLTSDIAEVQVAKGYSSPLLGPNLLGGVINLVTREPQKKLEGEAFIGTGSGNVLNSGLHIGSRWSRFFFEGSLDWLESDFYPLSGNFRINATQPNDHRVNSYQRDERFRGRVGWTPRGRDSYVFSYANQKGNAGDPPYSGRAPACPAGNAAVPFACVTPKYWQWPYWNTTSYYFNSNTSIGEMSAVRFRAFYDQYPSMASPSGFLVAMIRQNAPVGREFISRQREVPVKGSLPSREEQESVERAYQETKAKDEYLDYCEQCVRSFSAQNKERVALLKRQALRDLRRQEPNALGSNGYAFERHVDAMVNDEILKELALEIFEEWLEKRQASLF